VAQVRKRNLGPILDANGWAVNARAKMNVPFGASLTQIAVLPPGSQRDLVDPFAEKEKSVAKDHRRAGHPRGDRRPLVLRQV